MECGSQDLLCEVTSWLAENDLLAPWLTELAGRFGANANGVAGIVGQFARDYGQAVVGLVGVSFGFWRWWRYREHILHKRLEEYLRESDGRLSDGTRELLELIQRPSPGQKPKEALFADADLRVVLRERNWDKPAYALGVAASSDLQLEQAIAAINRRLATAKAMTKSLHLQLFSAHSLRGAIAASHRNGLDSKSASDALDQFKKALGIPGHARNAAIRELEAHQMRKLGLAGREVYEELAVLATEMEESRERDFLLARCKRYMAEMTVGRRPQNAYWLLTDTGEALALMAKCQPLDLWERLELADTQYLAAYCAAMSKYPGKERTLLDSAQGSYGGLVRDLSSRRWLRPRQYRRLRALANLGVSRVGAAKQGNYDVSWLPPQSSRSSSPQA